MRLAVSIAAAPPTGNKDISNSLYDAARFRIVAVALGGAKIHRLVANVQADLETLGDAMGAGDEETRAVRRQNVARGLLEQGEPES